MKLKETFDIYCNVCGELENYAIGVLNDLNVDGLNRIFKSISYDIMSIMRVDYSFDNGQREITSYILIDIDNEIIVKNFKDVLYECISRKF